MARKKKVRLEVALELPEGVALLDAAAYVREAAKVWSGRMECCDPFFHLHRKSVTVKPIKGKQ